MKVSKDVMSEIKLYQSQDYEIDRETETYIMMKKNTSKAGWHVVLAILFFWLIFLPNLLYYILSTKKHKIMK